MRNLRESLLFTQQEMTLLLGVSRSAITMYENGQRRLSPDASKMETLIMECHAVARTGAPAGEDKFQQEKALAYFTKELRYQVEKKLRQIDEHMERLQQMKEKYQQLQVRRTTLEKLKRRLEALGRRMEQGSNKWKQTLKQIQYVNHFHTETGLMLEQCNFIHQLQLQYDLDCLKAQKLVAENILKQAER